jgi:hypothetical protein
MRGRVGECCPEEQQQAAKRSRRGQSDGEKIRIITPGHRLAGVAVGFSRGRLGDSVDARRLATAGREGLVPGQKRGHSTFLANK